MWGVANPGLESQRLASAPIHPESLRSWADCCLPLSLSFPLVKPEVLISEISEILCKPGDPEKGAQRGMKMEEMRPRWARLLKGSFLRPCSLPGGVP